LSTAWGRYLKVKILDPLITIVYVFVDEQHRQMPAYGGHEVEQFVYGTPVLDCAPVEGGGRSPRCILVINQMQFRQRVDLVQCIELFLRVVSEVFINLDQVHFHFLVCFLNQFLTGS